MIRISGGTLRGRSIESPDGQHPVRPTTGRVRESLFSQLQRELPGARFLDLFSGSGLMAVEALSRGAVYALAVDRAPAQCDLIRRNFRKLGLDESVAGILCRDALALAAGKPPMPAFDIVFADPPYGFSGWEPMLSGLLEYGWLAEAPLMVCEQAAGELIPVVAGFDADTRRFGDTLITVYRPPIGE